MHCVRIQAFRLSFKVLAVAEKPHKLPPAYLMCSARQLGQADGHGKYCHSGPFVTLTLSRATCICSRMGPLFSKSKLDKLTSLLSGIDKDWDWCELSAHNARPLDSPVHHLTALSRKSCDLTSTFSFRTQFANQSILALNFSNPTWSGMS